MQENDVIIKTFITYEITTKILMLYQSGINCQVNSRLPNTYKSIYLLYQLSKSNSISIKTRHIYKSHLPSICPLKSAIRQPCDDLGCVNVSSTVVAPHVFSKLPCNFLRNTMMSTRQLAWLGKASSHSTTIRFPLLKACLVTYPKGKYKGSGDIIESLHIKIKSNILSHLLWPHG